MLRITRLPEATGLVSLLVEGRLVGDWVQVLEIEVARVPEPTSLSLDLAGVVFADAHAVRLLRAIAERGVRFATCSPLLSSLLESES